MGRGVGGFPFFSFRSTACLPSRLSHSNRLTNVSSYIFDHKHCSKKKKTQPHVLRQSRARAKR